MATYCWDKSGKEDTRRGLLPEQRLREDFASASSATGTS